MFETMSTNGGYVLAAVHNIQPDVPPENVVATHRSQGMRLLRAAICRSGLASSRAGDNLQPRPQGAVKRSVSVSRPQLQGSVPWATAARQRG